MSDETVNMDVKHGSSATGDAIPIISLEDTKNKRHYDPNQKPVNTTAKSEGQSIPKSRFDEVLAQKKEAIESVKAVVDSMMETIPEDMRDLVPNINNDPVETIKWIQSATQKGIFTPKQALNGLDTKRPASKPPIDLSNVSIDEKFKAGYKS